MGYARKPVKIDILDHKLMCCLDRVANVFTTKSIQKTMEKSDIDSLVNIAKLVKILVKEQQAAAKEASDEELENLNAK